MTGRLYAKEFESNAFFNVFIQLSINWLASVTWLLHRGLSKPQWVHIVISDRDERPVSLSILSNAEINVNPPKKGNEKR